MSGTRHNSDADTGAVDSGISDNDSLVVVEDPDDVANYLSQFASRALTHYRWVDLDETPDIKVTT